MPARRCRPNGWQQLPEEPQQEGTGRHNRKRAQAPVRPEGAAKYVLSFVGKEMEAVVNKTNAFALANDLGDDADSWPGNKVVLSTIYGQTPNGMGHIMHMRGVPTGHAAGFACCRRQPQPTQGNGAGNAYAAASQPAAGQPTAGGQQRELRAQRRNPLLAKRGGLSLVSDMVKELPSRRNAGQARRRHRRGRRAPRRSSVGEVCRRAGGADGEWMMDIMRSRSREPRGMARQRL